MVNKILKNPQRVVLNVFLFVICLHKEIEDLIGDLKSKLKGEDTQAVKSAIEKLTSRFQEVSSELYKNVSSSSSNGGSKSSSQFDPSGDATSSDQPKDPDVVDADFEMVDEKK